MVFFSLLHLLTMGQIELTNDEAHYALFGYYLDWSYFDHPPLVGWLNAITLLFSDSDFAMRIWPLLLAALSSYLLYGFSRELFPQASAWIGTVTVLLYQSSLIAQALSLAMLPDTPLIPVSIAAMWMLYRALTQQHYHLWLYVGILFGLAGLSKYTAITLVVTALMGIWIYRDVHAFASKGFWLGMVAAVIVITPVLYWNLQHDWISIRYQISHGAPDKPWLWQNLLISQTNQLVSYTPVIYLTAWIVIVRTLIQQPASRAEKFVLAFSLPVLLLFGVMSGYEQTLPHWPALGYIALTPLMAKWLLDKWNNKGIRIFTVSGFTLSLVLIIAMHLVLAVPVLPFKENRHPLADIYGWQQVAMHALKLQQQMQQQTGQHAGLFVGNWSQFARLAWYAKPVPVQLAGQRFGQHTLWYGNAERGSNGILVVPPAYRDIPESGLSRFARCDELPDLPYRINGRIATTYYFFQCFDYRGTP